MIQNPSNLYSGGNVKFDSQPTVNLYGQVLARQQAKFDAMDAYEKSRVNSVNDAGMRDIDRKTLDDKLSEIRYYYNTNKKTIQKGNSQEAFDYEKKFRDVKDLISQSKDLAARHNAALQFYNDRLKQDQRLPDDFMTELHKNDVPIGSKFIDPSTGEEWGATPFDVTKWASEAKPFTQDKYLASFKDLKRTPLAAFNEPVDGNPLKQREVTVEKFDKDAKDVIAARAADRYENSYSFANQVQSEIKDPARRKQLGNLFQQEYGIAPSMPSDYAIGYTLEMIQPSIRKEKIVDNKDAIMTRQEKFRREIQDRIDNRTFSLANLRRSWAVADQEAQDKFVKDVYDGYIKAGKVAPEVTKEYEKSDGKGHKVPIDKEVFNNDGTVDMVVFKLDKKGNPTTEIDEAYSTKGVPRQQIEAKTRKVFETPTTNTGTHKPSGKKKLNW